jgi:hypothetical protein
MKSKNLRRAIAFWGTVFLCLVLVSLGHTQAQQGQETQTPEVKKAPTLEEQWGVQLKPLRLTGEGLFLDFRFRVIDPEKAGPLLQKGTKPYLVDQKSGKTFQVPTTKVGPMRATATKPKSDKDYTMLFNNTNRFVKKGDKVTVVIGGFKAENLVVE